MRSTSGGVLAARTSLITIAGSEGAGSSAPGEPPALELARQLAPLSGACVRPGFVGHRRFFAPGPAFGAGLAIGAYPYYYGDPYSYDPGYYYGDAPVTASPDAVSYCMQRFRTYDPSTGTYIGRGGVRLSCP